MIATGIYDRFGHFNDAPDDQPGVCLAVVGEPPYAEGQGVADVLFGDSPLKM